MKYKQTLLKYMQKCVFLIMKDVCQASSEKPLYLLD